LGRKLYAFRATDPFKKDAVPHTGTAPPSLNGRAAPEKVTARYGKGVAVLNGNGGENRGKAEEYLLFLVCYLNERRILWQKNKR
jgi:hypothetical protein